jgi:hypothetical protein
MRSAPRAARATVGSSKPASRYAFGPVPQRVVLQMAPATITSGKVVSHKEPSTMLGWSSTAGVRVAVGSSELASLYAFGSVPQRVVQMAPAAVGSSELMSHKKPSSTLG